MRSRAASAHGGARASLALAAAAVVLVFVVPAGWWPWDHDEVHSLIELGRLPLGSYPGPMAQLERMHRLVPVWWVLQNAALSVLPMNEWGTRMLPAISGAAAVIAMFLLARRTWGEWFGWSMLVFAGGSQALVWLAQQGRFYPLALLWLTLALASLWVRDARARFDGLTIVLATAAVLSHNLTLVVFGLAAVAAGGLWALGRLPWVPARRAVVAAAVTSTIYLFYLRPIMSGWVAGTTGGTEPLVSLVAQVGVPAMGFAVLGIWQAWQLPADPVLRWCSVVLGLCLVFVATVPLTMSTWNPRYALFFMLPIWVMAAAGAASIAGRLPSASAKGVWLGAVFLLLVPKLASHFVDGSRHDFRTAAGIVAEMAPRDPVLSNWPATLQYYLTPQTGQRPAYWDANAPLPAGETIIVIASNAWQPVLGVGRRAISVIGEVGKRRFDEQSHLIRIYRIAPAEK